MFDRFRRAPGAPAGGTGLGLAIAASIAHLHDGSIAVASRPGSVATFTVRPPEQGERAIVDAPPSRTTPAAERR